MNIYERTIARIDKVLEANEGKRMDRYGVEDRSVLTYIRSSLTPEGQEARAKWPENTGALDGQIEVANMRLRPYEEADND